MVVRFQILSDLHIDSYVRRGLAMGEIPKTDCDAIIVAGDTANGDMGIRWLIKQAHRLNKPIFVITGNHEYFGEDVARFDQHLKQLTEGTQVTLLQCDTVLFAGVRLLGATLWTDYTYQAREDTLAAAKQVMRDYQQIYRGRRLFTPEDSMLIHEQHKSWLLSQLHDVQSTQQPTVVITHHSISPNSVSAQYQDLPSNAAFVTDLSEILESEYAPSLWVHGHTHEAFDYVQGNTRVIVNPRAYPSEISSTSIKFDWSKTIEVVV